jgi:hypothetical protein
MSTASAESSPSRGSGLKQVLTKARRKRGKKTDDTPSIASEGSDSHGLPALISRELDKLKSDGGDDEAGGISGLSKILPVAIKSKRRAKILQKEAEERESEEAARGRSVAERGTLVNDDGGDSTSMREGDRSSLITYESETEE